MEGADIATRWPIWKNKLNHYYFANELDQKKGQTIVSTLLTILGECAYKIYQDFTFIKTEKNDQAKNIEEVLEQFDKYLEQRVNKIYERCIFQKRQTRIRIIRKICQ